MAVDLMLNCEVLQRHVESGYVACAINHKMQDFGSKREKAFDLVFHRPDPQDATNRAHQTFMMLLRDYGIQLTAAQRAKVSRLADVPVRTVRTNAVKIAFEAKACMTEFGKARPRLYDELNSSHPTIHGNIDSAIAAGCVMVNASSSFISPLRNADGPESAGLVVTEHRQPESYMSVVAKMRELPVKSGPVKDGFDAFGIIAVDCRNDGTTVAVVEDPKVLKNVEYRDLINRVVALYESQFGQFSR